MHSATTRWFTHYCALSSMRSVLYLRLNVTLHLFWYIMNRLYLMAFSLILSDWIAHLLTYLLNYSFTYALIHLSNYSLNKSFSSRQLLTIISSTLIKLLTRWRKCVSAARWKMWINIKYFNTTINYTRLVTAETFIYLVIEWVLTNE